MWPFRKKTIRAQCVCHIFDPRNDAPVTQLREIGEGREQVPPEMYERFNDNGNIFLVFMASKDEPGKMDGWFSTKENALEVCGMYFGDDNLSRLMRLAATPADPAARDRATDDFMKAWMFYNEKLTFKPTVSLAEIIYGFSIPMRSRWENEYSTLKPWGDWLFWSVIEDGIIRAGKLEPDRIKAAVPEASRTTP